MQICSRLHLFKCRFSAYLSVIIGSQLSEIESYQIFLWKLYFFQDSLMNRKLKRTTFIMK